MVAIGTGICVGLVGYCCMLSQSGLMHLPVDFCAKVGATVNARATRTVEILRLFIEILTCSGLDVAASSLLHRVPQFLIHRILDNDSQWPSASQAAPAQHQSLSLDRSIKTTRWCGL